MPAKADKKGHKMKEFKLLVLALFVGLLAQNALAKPPHERASETPPHLANGYQNAMPPHLAHKDLPHIKGINDEIFLAASLEKQIKALQIDSDSRASERKNSQKFRDERHKLELEKKILQARLLHAQDAQRQDLLTKLYQNEQALSKNKVAEREFKDKQELQRVESIYKALR